jgi:hypothetical protein
MTRLALTAMAFHDLTVLGPPFGVATPSLTALEDAMKSNARILIPAALSKFKPTPMPVWWRPEQMIQLHETKSGRLIAATVASGATLEELDADLQLRAAELLSPQR